MSSYLEGCTAPNATRTSSTPPWSSWSRRTTRTIKYSTVQNWYPGDKEGKGGIYNFVTKRGKCRGRELEDLLDPGRDRLGHHLEVPELHPAGRQFGRRVLLGGDHQQLPAGRHRHEDDPHRQEHAQHDRLQGHLGRARPEHLSRPGEDPARAPTGARNYSQCDSLLIGDKCGAHTFPYIEVRTDARRWSTRPRPRRSARTSSSIASSAGIGRGRGAHDRQRLLQGGVPASCRWSSRSRRRSCSSVSLEGSVRDDPALAPEQGPVGAARIALQVSPAFPKPFKPMNLSSTTRAVGVVDHGGSTPFRSLRDRTTDSQITRPAGGRGRERGTRREEQIACRWTHGRRRAARRRQPERRRRAEGARVRARHEVFRGAVRAGRAAQRIENFQAGPRTSELAKKIVAADPEVRHGPVLPLGRHAWPGEAEKEYQKARELAKNASEGERRFIEAMYHARVNQGVDFAKSIEPMEALAKDYPGRAAVYVILGQLYTGDDQAEKARLAFEKAQAIGPRSPRVEAFLAGDDLLKGRLRQGARHLPVGREEPAQGVGAVRHPLRRHLQPPLRGQRRTPPSSRCAPTWPSTRRAGSTSSSPRSSSGTPWRASTWRTAGSTRP